VGGENGNLVGSIPNEDSGDPPCPKPSSVGESVGEGTPAKTGAGAGVNTGSVSLLDGASVSFPANNRINRSGFIVSFLLDSARFVGLGAKCEREGKVSTATGQTARNKTSGFLLYGRSSRVLNELMRMGQVGLYDWLVFKVEKEVCTSSLATESKGIIGNPVCLGSWCVVPTDLPRLLEVRGSCLHFGSAVTSSRTRIRRKNVQKALFRIVFGDWRILDETEFSGTLGHDNNSFACTSVTIKDHRSQSEARI
jgi:hypothetical protein